MQIDKLECPACGAAINISIEGRKAIFCPYCGSQFSIDDGNREFKFTYNENKRYTDDAAVERERRKDRQNAREHMESKWYYMLIVFLFLLMVVVGVYSDHREDKMAKSGKIQTGQPSSYYKGKNYESVVEQLEEIGFTNVKAIDMDDAGFFNKEDSIDSITIGGDAQFTASDYFDADEKIVITYH